VRRCSQEPPANASWRRDCFRKTPQDQALALAVALAAAQ
jgi:hypothetical protein